MERSREPGGLGEEATLRLVQSHAAELLRFARRFSWCADDAHDAYQRSLEILVRRIRTDPPDNPLSWLRTVLRHEAFTVRRERERLVGRDEVDFERHEGRELDDPAEQVLGAERLDRVAEALQRLKPQEVTALVLRAEGLSYKEIGARNGWTYTKVNRCVTEGRRALIERLTAIESGAECERWLPQLSALADGEASLRQRAELRPHLRSCPACRATLREFREAPSQVAAFVPVALLPAAVVGGDPVSAGGHVAAAIHGLLERTTFAAARVQGAVEAVSGTKVAAVAASTAALAGGGAALERAVEASPRPPAPTAQIVEATPELSSAPVFTVRPRPPADPAEVAGAAGATAPAGEFAPEAAPDPPPADDPPPPPEEPSALGESPAPGESPPASEFAGP